MKMPTASLKPAPYRRQDRHAGDTRFTITSVPDDHAVLAAYFDDYLTDHPPGELRLPAFQLNVWTGIESFRAALGRLDGMKCRPVEPVPGVVLMEGITSAGRRCYSPVRDTVENAPRAWVASIDDGERFIDLHCESPAIGPRHALRIIRETMMRGYENAGGIIFHGAGVDVDGRGVMICGNRNAGKTTTMATILHLFGPKSALLSNDRLIFYGEERLAAVPLPVPTARGTIDAFPELGKAATEALSGRPRPRAPSELPTAFGSSIKIGFPARGFAEAFGATLSPAAYLAAVIIPSSTDTDEPVRVDRLAPEEANVAVSEACFTPRDEFWRPWLIRRERPDTALAACAAKTCARIATTVPCIGVRFGVHGVPMHLETALADVIGGLR